jgi:hypothetical protein
MRPKQKMVFILAFRCIRNFTLLVGTDVHAQLTTAVTEMILERRKREAVERILVDVERECCLPTVVPAMLEALNKILLDTT